MKKPVHIFVPYGPVGSPECQLWEDFSETGESAVREEFSDWLTRNRISGNTPTVFYITEETLEEQGYYILPVRDDEVVKAAIAQLVAPLIYRRAQESEPGRNLAVFERYLPTYTTLANCRQLEEGDNNCDHDFGLESWDTVYITENGEVRHQNHDDNLKDVGTYHDTVTCTRCGAVHGYAQAD